MADVNPKVPNVLSDAERAANVVGQLRNLQQQQLSLEVQRATAGHAANEVLPPGKTYAQQSQDLQASQERLLAEFADVREEIDRQVQVQKG